jgi:hypothetical protein
LTSEWTIIMNMAGFFFPDFPRLFHTPCMPAQEPEAPLVGVGMCANVKAGRAKRAYYCNVCGKEPPYEWVVALKTVRMGHELNRS